jgi:peptide/nickel transport system ATP-binding protein
MMARSAIAIAPFIAGSAAGRTAAASPVLRVRNLTVSFRQAKDWRPIVRGLQLDLSPRETLAIVGESGSGKSVTALSIMRLLPKLNSQTTGSIVFNGQELTALSDRGMERVRGNEISMIFQEPMTSLNPVLTVGFQIAEGLRAHRGVSHDEAISEAVRLLDRVRVPSASSRALDFPHQLSGGMRQRAMIAMALTCQPKLLIADEPTTALDVTIQAQILSLIKELQEENGMAVLFITHDMGVVAEIADHTLVMYDGECVETGETPRIFAAPNHPYTRLLLAAVPRLGSMAGRRLPERFPLVDRSSGQVEAVAPLADALDETAPPLLKVSGLKTRFDVRSGVLGGITARVHAVEDVSFSIQPGETLALVGESGSGKSTIGRTIVGLVPAHEGMVLLEGRDALRANRAALRETRRRMQVLFQDPFASLDPRQTVGAAIAEPLLVHRLAERSSVADQVSSSLAKVGLSSDMAVRFPHEFSGGQRQRICLARILGLKPKLIIADECVSALDVSVKARVINLMMELQSELKLAYLFISHDLAVVERMSHRIAVMYLGEIVEIGPRAEVLGNPQHPYTRKLLAAVPVPDPRQRSRTRIVDQISELGGVIRSPKYVAPTRQYRTVSPGHLVQCSS